MFILGFQHLGDFQCIASACPKDCCTGWRIEIDDKTLEYYRNVSGEFGDFIQKTLDEYLVEEKDRSYLNVKGGRCPFLTEQRLCSIQLTLGEEHLSSVCSTFPRAVSSHDELEIVYISSSCPEYARMLLSEENGLDVELIEEDSDEDLQAFSFVEYEGTLNQASVSKDALLLCISIAQNRAFSIEQRQRLLLIFNRALQDALDAEDYAQSLDICRYFSDPALYASLVADVSGSFHIAEKAAFIRKLGIMRSDNRKNPLLGENLRDLLQLFDEMDMDTMMQLHSQLEAMNSSQAFLLENILTHLLIAHYLDNKNGNFFQNTVSIIVLIQLYRILAAAAALRGQFSEEERALLLCSLSRAVEHSSHVMHSLYKVIQDKQVDDLQSLFRLIS